VPETGGVAGRGLNRGPAYHHESMVAELPTKQAPAMSDAGGMGGMDF
jgi:hypothetical protein